MVGLLDMLGEIVRVGELLGRNDGTTDGWVVGDADVVGGVETEGDADGDADGLVEIEGDSVGWTDKVGDEEGESVGWDDSVGDNVGSEVVG